jgi:SAM-dependent methyltransferase
MNMGTENLSKSYIQVPVLPPPTRSQRLKYALVGSILSPAYWLLAHRYHMPGLQFHLKSTLLGLRLLCNRKASIPLTLLQYLLLYPMDSTRYFEFDFMWRALSESSIQRYLDVSSPRLFPILLLRRQHKLTADLINPDSRDLALTTQLAKSSGIEARCRFHNCLVETAPIEPGAFDVITSISVVEHIPQDTQALQKMWGLLRPCGRLLVSVPCAAQASEQYINNNEYGLLEPDGRGFVFWQRLYDSVLLNERIFSVTGPPRYYSIYGEKTPGSFRKNAELKRANPVTYSFWREPYMMGQGYDYFDTVADLPGEGVIAMEFVKP